MSEIIRAFLSIDITDYTLLSRIEAVQKQLDIDAAKMKIVETENIHYTIRFFGDTQLTKINDIKSHLENIEINSFDVEIRGVGAFPNRYRPRVIWIGAGRNGEQITQLKREIDEAIRDLGYQPEKKFTPHATIARVRYVKDAKRLSSNLETISEEIVGMMKISNISMKKSTLTPSGPIYETLWKLPKK